MPRPSQKRVPHTKGLPRNYDHYDHEITISRKSLADMIVTAVIDAPEVGESTMTNYDRAMTSTIKLETTLEPHNKADKPDSSLNPADYTADRCPAWIFDDSLAVSTADIRRTIAEVTGIDTAAAGDTGHPAAADHPADIAANPADARPRSDRRSTAGHTAANTAATAGPLFAGSSIV